MGSHRKQEAALDLQKHASSGLKVASATHEVKNFAESLTNLVYLLQQNPNLDDDARKYVHLVENELEHMRDFITRTLAHYREIAHLNPASVLSILDAVLQFYRDRIAEKNIQIEKRYESDGMVMADSEELRAVFSNLVVNALQALQPGGKLIVRLYRTWINAQTEGVRVVVADNGAGIPQEHHGKIFQQSFTTKGKRGNGLGLWMTAKIIRQHGGTIRFRSSTTKGRSGTVFSVFLPSAGYQKPAPSANVPAEPQLLPNSTAAKLPIYAHTRILSPTENRVIFERLQVENVRLLKEIRVQREHLLMEVRAQRKRLAERRRFNRGGGKSDD